MSTRARTTLACIAAAAALSTAGAAHAAPSDLLPPVPPIQTSTVPALVDITPVQLTLFPAADNIIPAPPQRYTVRITDQAVLNQFISKTNPETGAYNGFITGTVKTGSGGYNRNTLLPRTYSWHLDNVDSPDVIAFNIPCGGSPDYLERDLKLNYNTTFCSGFISHVAIRPDTSTLADIDANQRIGIADYNLLRAAYTGPTRRCWQRSTAPGDDTACAADLNDDARIDTRDALILRQNWQGLESNRPNVYEFIAQDRRLPGFILPAPTGTYDAVDVLMTITDPAGRVFGHALPQISGTACFELDRNNDRKIDDAAQLVSNIRGNIRIRIERQPDAANGGTFDLIMRLNGESFTVEQDVAITSLPRTFTVFALVPHTGADLNGDSRITIDDLNTFTDLYTKGQMDYNGDGKTDAEDLMIFMDDYQAE